MSWGEGKDLAADGLPFSASVISWFFVPPSPFFSIPILHYLMHTAPCFLSDVLIKYDNVLRGRFLVQLLMCYCQLMTQHGCKLAYLLSWGGLGIHRATQMAPPPTWPPRQHPLTLFLLSLSYHSSLATPHADAALACWSNDTTLDPPQGQSACVERSWDKLSASVWQSALINSAQDDADRARLLATATRESGIWLHALPNTSLGLRLDDAALRIAVGFRLDTAVCVAHQCQHCGEEVNNQGRHHRHAAVNSIINRAFETAESLQDWNQLVYPGQTARDLMGLQWCHGHMANCSFEMLLAPTRWLILTEAWLAMVRARWLLQLNTENCQNMLT